MQAKFYRSMNSGMKTNGHRKLVADASSCIFKTKRIGADVVCAKNAKDSQKTQEKFAVESLGKTITEKTPKYIHCGKLFVSIFLQYQVKNSQASYISSVIHNWSPGYTFNFS